jgi:hypothetical protein
MNRATRYDAIVATLVGISALVVSAYTAYMQRQQVRAQVYPILWFATGYSDNDVHITISNKGSGPALIRNVFMTDDGKPIHHWLELTRVAVGGEVDGHLHYSSFGRSVLSAGEEREVYRFTCPKNDEHDHSSAPADPHAGLPPPPGAEFAPRAEACKRVLATTHRISLSVCYCSTLGDCWNFVDAPGQDPITTETPRCPDRSDRSFN